MGIVYETGYLNNNSTTATSIDYIFYRGNDLGTVSSDNIDTFMSEHDISTGLFTDLCIGDYFTASCNFRSSGPLSSSSTTSTITFRIMDIDPYYNISASGIAGTHHILVVPDQILTTASMNSSTTNSTGYKGSTMYSKTIASIDTTLAAIFGDYYLSYNEIISTDNSTSTTTVSVKSILMNELEAFGDTTSSISSSGLLDYQLPGFAQNSSLLIAYDTSSSAAQWWLRDCNNRNTFCSVDTTGAAASSNAGGWGNTSYGVRPRFCLG
jgi:hypothetical protein